MTIYKKAEYIQKVTLKHCPFSKLTQNSKLIAKARITTLNSPSLLTKLLTPIVHAVVSTVMANACYNTSAELSMIRFQKKVMIKLIKYISKCHYSSVVIQFFNYLFNYCNDCHNRQTCQFEKEKN